MNVKRNIISKYLLQERCSPHILSKSQKQRWRKHFMVFPFKNTIWDITQLFKPDCRLCVKLKTFITSQINRRDKILGFKFNFLKIQFTSTILIYFTWQSTTRIRNKLNFNVDHSSHLPISKFRKVTREFWIL